jgi:hypothetical protein
MLDDMFRQFWALHLNENLIVGFDLRALINAGVAQVTTDRSITGFREFAL